MLCLFTFIFLSTGQAVGSAPGESVELNKLLTLGLDAEDEYQIFSGAAVAVANKAGTIYVLNPGTFNVIAFDEKGSFLFEFGSEGEGPGEFLGPNAISVLPNQNIAVFDIQIKRVTFFDSKGAYLGTKRLPRNVQNVVSPYFAEDQSCAFFAVTTSPKGHMNYQLNLYDKDMKLQKTFLDTALPPRNWGNAAGRDFWVEFLTHQFEAVGKGFPMVTLLPGSRWVTANSTRYQGTIVHQNAQPEKQFEHKARPRLFSEEAKHRTFEAIWAGFLEYPGLANNLTKPVYDKALAKAKVPEHLAPLQALFRIGSGFGFLSSFDPISGEGDLDVFDENGNLIGTTPYQGVANNIFGVGDKIYASGFNEDGDVLIEVFSIKGLPEQSH